MADGREVSFRPIRSRLLRILTNQSAAGHLALELFVTFSVTAAVAGARDRCPGGVEVKTAGWT